MILTDRLCLVSPHQKYVRQIFEICHNEQANYYTPKGKHNNIEETKEWIKRWCSHWQKYQFGYYIVIRQNDQAVVGICGYEYRQLNHTTVLNLFYKLHPRYHGEGYAYEAIKQITSQIEKFDNVTTKVIRTNRHNYPSIKLALRLGFVRNQQLDGVINIDDIVFLK